MILADASMILADTSMILADTSKRLILAFAHGSKLETASGCSKPIVG